MTMILFSVSVATATEAQTNDIAKQQAFQKMKAQRELAFEKRLALTEEQKVKYLERLAKKEAEAKLTPEEKAQIEADKLAAKAKAEEEKAAAKAKAEAEKAAAKAEAEKAKEKARLEAQKAKEKEKAKAEAEKAKEKARLEAQKAKEKQAAEKENNKAA